MKISFRKIEEKDISFLNATRNFFAKDFLHDSRIFTVEETREWFFSNLPDYWIIEESGKPVGYFRISNYSTINKNLYLGADIHPEYQRKGIAYSSYLIFIPYLFEKYNLNKISLEVLSSNSRAINLYKKLGFVIEGVKREEILKENKYVDSIIMSILKNERK